MLIVIHHRSQHDSPHDYPIFVVSLSTFIAMQINIHSGQADKSSQSLIITECAQCSAGQSCCRRRRTT